MIISIANPKGGVGKTTLAVNLATTLISKYSDTRILELDLQRSSSLWAGYRVERGITPEIPVAVVSSVKQIPNVTAPYRDNPKSLLLVDCGGIDSDFNRSAMSVSDLVIIPTRTSQVEVYALTRAMSVLKAVGKTGYVLNNGSFPASISKLTDLAEYVSVMDGFKLLHTVVRLRADFQDAYGAGMSVIEYNRNSRAAEEIMALAKEIHKLLKEVRHGQV
ncbi:MAG: AAA family ATPase [Syntrophorhabdaceae bacterium]|nr:AAA family ATPase [Syntrophorhabdaceae bacterium]